MKNKSAFVVIMIVSLILNLCFVPSAVQADGVGFVKPTEIKVSHELKDVVSSTKYVKGLTKAKE